MLSNKRVSDLHTLNDFMKNSHDELTWLNEKEDKELGRDWADRNLSAQEVSCINARLLYMYIQSSRTVQGKNLISSHFQFFCEVVIQYKYMIYIIPGGEVLRAPDGRAGAS